jgi:HAMP domain-containing protein
MKTESSDLFVMKMIYRLSDEASKLETAQKLAAELNISAEKALSVLNRYPGPLIKPMSRQRVEEIANSFIRVGVPVEVIAASAQVTANPPSPQPVREAVVPASVPVLMEPLGLTPRLEPLMPPMTPLAPMTPLVPMTPISVAPGFSAVAALAQPQEAQPSIEPLGQIEEVEANADLEPAVRTSLRTKLVAASLVPVLFIGISALSLMAINVPRGLSDLNHSSTKQLITAIVLDLKPSEIENTQQHLREAVQFSAGDLGFAQIKASTAPDQTIFVTKAPEMDGLVARYFASFAASPEFQAEDPVWNSTGELAGSYEVFKGQVFESPTGQRSIHFDDSLGKVAATPSVGRQVFEFSVGSSNAKAQSIVSQQLGLMFGLIALVLGAAAVLALLFARSISSSIVRLTEAADTISLGEFDVPVERKSNDELGDLAEALERMRISLRSALERLRRRR